jgi:glycerate kinase
MTVLVAPDKFKGSLTARQVVEHLGQGLADRGVAYRGLPLADGGDGSVAAAIDAGFSAVEVAAAGPTGDPNRGLIAFDGRTAVVEVAGTCGLAALPDGILQPLRSSTRGVGLAARAALEQGATRLVLAAGGSASTGRNVEGAEFFLDLLNFDAAVQDCDVVITGEGRMDSQTREGTLPAAVARRAGNRLVIAVVGRSDVDQADLNLLGIEQVYALADRTHAEPARDPALSAQLLRDLGRTIPLRANPSLRH